MAKRDKDRDEKKLVVGDLLEIEQTDRPAIKTRVDIIEGNTIWAMDFISEVFWDARWKEQAYSVRFIRGERCFAFLASIEGNEIVEGLRMTKLNVISGVEEIQRRSAFRLQFMFDVYIRTLGEGKEEDSEFILCQGLDISEGGLGLNTEKRWSIGTKVECMFIINGEEYSFPAQVVRRLDWVMGGQYVYRLGLKFTDEDEKQLRKMRRFIFQQQTLRAAEGHKDPDDWY